MKNYFNDAREVIKEVRHISSSVLGFMAFVILCMILGIVCIAWLSDLPLWTNLIILAVFMGLLVYIVIRAVNGSIKNPIPFVFNQSAFITVMREELGDAKKNKTYYPDQLTDKNTVAPSKLSSPKQIEEGK